MVWVRQSLCNCGWLSGRIYNSRARKLSCPYWPLNRSPDDWVGLETAKSGVRYCEHPGSRCGEHDCGDRNFQETRSRPREVVYGEVERRLQSWSRYMYFAVRHCISGRTNRPRAARMCSWASCGIPTSQGGVGSSRVN